MLIAGVLTFVVSVSIAVSLELTPRRDAGPGNPVPAVNVSETPAAIKAIPPAMPPPVSIPPPEAVEPALPLPETPVVDDAPPPEENVPAEAPATDEVPAAVAPEAPPAGAPVVDPELTPPPDAFTPPPAAVPPVDATIPAEQPSIWTRIKDRLKPGNDDAPIIPAPPADPAPPGQ